MYLLGTVVVVLVSIYWCRQPRNKDSRPVGRVRTFFRTVVAKFWFAAQWGVFIAVAIGTLRLLGPGGLISETSALFGGALPLGTLATAVILFLGLSAIAGAFIYFAVIFVSSMLAWPIRTWRSRKPGTNGPQPGGDVGVTPPPKGDSVPR